MDRRPNIVQFITDDTGDCMLGYAGGPVLTPRIDSIARDGVVATDFHCAAPACTPSRYSYLTGLYPGRCPAPRFRESFAPGEAYNLGFQVDLLPGQPNLARCLQQAGYATGYTGKWHTGSLRSSFHGHAYSLDDDPQDPEVSKKLKEDYDAMRAEVRGCGFDYAEALAWGNTDNRPLKALRYHNLEWHTEAALRFLDAQAGGARPFFLCMATTTMHGPHHVKSMQTDGRAVEWGLLDEPPRGQPPRQSVFDRLRAAGLEIDHHTAGALWMDDAFGAVLDRLEAMGVADETIVIWSTDHGMGTISGKFTCYQGGVRIPFCMKWPGRIAPGSSCGALLQNVDLMPTLLDMAGVAPPPGHDLDGRSRLAQLAGAADDREELYFEWGYTRALRTRRWKYIAWRHPAGQIEDMRSGAARLAYLMHGVAGMDFGVHMYPHYFAPDQLYDLENDPAEQRNLAHDPAHAGTLAEMRGRLQQHLDSIGASFDLSSVDPWLSSRDFRRLTELTRQDQAMYDNYYYREKAY